MTNDMRNTRLDLLVRKDGFSQTRWQETAVPEPKAGELLLKVDGFALTANNVTYAAYGDALGYWQFYPQAEEGWGQIPVWGFADVIASRCQGVEPGERLFGYWPMASHAVLTPSELDASAVVEGAACRQSLNPFYNRYSRCAADPAYDPAQEGWQSIFRPLGLTAFLIDEYLAEQKFWAASTVILASASSKTAIGTAHFLSERGACRVLGLTSAGNKAFVESLACYDGVISYDDLAELPQDQESVFVDMAGDAAVVASVHSLLGEHLRQSITVGGTHWTQINPSQSLPGPAPEFFFAPDHIIQRLGQWGNEGFQKRFAVAWVSLMPRVQKGLKLVERQGKDAVSDTLMGFINGQIEASEAHVLRL